MDSMDFAGLTIIVWFIVGVIRGLMPRVAYDWLHGQPERVWGVVYLASAALLIASAHPPRDIPLAALTLAVAAVGADAVRKRTPIPGVDDLMKGAT